MKKMGPVGAMGLVVGALGFGVASSGCATTETKAEPVHARRPPVVANQPSISPEKLEEIDAFFRRKAAQLQFDCYNTEVEKTGKKYEGHVSIALLVEPGGKAANVSLTGSTLNSPGIETCIAGAVSGWEWPDVNTAAPYTGTINFKPAW